MRRSILPTLVALAALAACGHAPTGDGLRTAAQPSDRPPYAETGPLSDGPADPAPHPKARPAPDRRAVEARAGHALNMQQFLDAAGEQLAVGAGPGVHIKDLPGPYLPLLAWGDVVDYQYAQDIAGPDDHVLRIAKRVGRGSDRSFYMVTFNPATGDVLYDSATPGTDDNYGDLEATPWRD